MENTNLVPSLSQDLIKRLMPFQPITIQKNENGNYSYTCKVHLSREFWHEIREYLDKEPENLVHYLNDDQVKSLSDAAPLTIIEHENYYSFTGKNIDCFVDKNVDMNSNFLIDYKGIAETLNNRHKPLKVDAKIEVKTPTTVREKFIVNERNEIDNVLSFLDGVGIDVNKITLDQYAKFQDFLNNNFIRKE